ncbi:MAG: HAD-IA family hydrolase [Burkholderiaceae bacterium]|nr:HAD-IA family hydrolase [Burkholderiaceae bacterium]
MVRHRVWLFDLDNTLHNASCAAFGGISQGMTDYMVRELALGRSEADALRREYWHRYGATLLGLVRHHGTQAAHFLHHTHLLPGLEGRVHGHPHDFDALARLHGRKYILTNAPRAYTDRVLGVLGIGALFDDVLSIEDMAMFGQLRPKPDARMLRRVAVKLGALPTRCVLVEDTLAHQKAARRIGMATVWMQRWVRQAAKPITPPAKVGVYLHRKPAYVCARISSLQQLLEIRLP